MSKSTTLKLSTQSADILPRYSPEGQGGNRGHCHLNVQMDDVSKYLNLTCLRYKDEKENKMFYSKK
jgi:hypothetical protein